MECLRKLYLLLKLQDEIRILCLALDVSEMYLYQSSQTVYGLWFIA